MKYAKTSEFSRHSRNRASAKKALAEATSEYKVKRIQILLLIKREQDSSQKEIAEKLEML